MARMVPPHFAFDGKPPVMARFKPCDGFSDSKWIYYGDGTGLKACSGFSETQPTHWKPLDPPPIEEQSE